MIFFMRVMAAMVGYLLLQYLIALAAANWLTVLTIWAVCNTIGLIAFYAARYLGLISINKKGLNTLR